VKKVFYEKRGRRYVPVAEYDQSLMDSFPKGASLVVNKTGGSSRIFKIDPAYAPMLAAGEIARDAIHKAIHEATRMKPSRTPITAEQRAAWEHLGKVFGVDSYALHYDSTSGIAQAAIDEFSKQAEKLLTNPAVRKAYDHFILTAKLAASTENEQVA
jgi:hypothetical protein